MPNLIAIGELVAQGQPGHPTWGPGYPPWGWGMMSSGWGIFMMIFRLLFWGLVIVGIVLLVRYLVHLPSSKSSEDALEILRKRYARGEIQKAEYEEKKKDLTA